MIRGSVVIARVALCCGLLAGGSPAARADILAVTNRFLDRSFESNGGRFGSAFLENKLTGHRAAFASSDFRLKFLDGRELTGADFELVRTTLSNKGGIRFDFHLTNETHHIEARVEAEVRANEPWVRKRLLLRQSGEELLTLDEVDVEHARLDARVTVPTASPRGQPLVFDGEWFAGLEFPGADNLYTNGVLALRQYPGVALGPQPWASEWSVMGVAPAGKAREAFAAYLAKIAVPPRTHTHYNSWYDLRRAEMSTQAFKETFDRFRVKLDSFVPDDGWQKPDSVWQTDPAILPDGWKPLADHLKRNGSRLGLWMPLCGYKLDTQWGAANGYEVATGGKYYCLSGPNYQAALCGRIQQMFRDYGLNYFKHDFNFFKCTEPNHGHLPDARHSIEANVRAQIKLLDWMRQVNSNVFLNVTSCMWLSPWWLQHADAVWRGGSDYGGEKGPLSWEPRDWEITYRDGVLHRDATRDGPLFPISRMMTHGVTDGRHARLGGPDEPLDKWADNLMTYLGYGVRMRELYLTPSELTDRQWTILKKALAWADANAGALDHGEWVGGNPTKGELYGIEHRGNGRTIWLLRNPAPQTQAIELNVPAGKQLAQLYPCRGDVAGRAVTVRGLGTVIVETVEMPTGRVEPPLPAPEVRFSGDAGLLKMTVDANPDATRARLIAVVEGPTQTLTMKAMLNGQSARARKVPTSDWAAFVLPLAPGKNDIELAFDAGAGLFASGERKLSEWLEVTREQPADDAPFGIEFSRLTVPIVAPGPLPVAKPPRVQVTAAELARATEAKLHLRIFGSNAEPPFNDKPLSLNGVVLGNLPANKGTVDQWQEVVLDLPRDARETLRADNELVLVNRGGDNFKISGFALAANVPGKGWAETPMNTTIYSSHSGWAYSQGAILKKGRLAVRLKFP